MEGEPVEGVPGAGLPLRNGTLVAARHGPAGPAVPGGSLGSCVRCHRRPPGKAPSSTAAAAAGAGCPLRDSLNRKPGQQQQQQQAAGWMPPGTLPGILGEPHTAPECVPHQTIVLKAGTADRPNSSTNHPSNAEQNLNQAPYVMIINLLPLCTACSAKSVKAAVSSLSAFPT